MRHGDWRTQGRRVQGWESSLAAGGELASCGWPGSSGGMQVIGALLLRRQSPRVADADAAAADMVLRYRTYNRPASSLPGPTNLRIVLRVLPYPNAAC